jgi:Tfp pilus assembly protein PilX
MVSNMHDSTLSFQAAESGLRDCEQFFIEVLHRVEATSANGQNTVWEKDTVASQSSDPDYWWQDFDFWETVGTPYDPDMDLTDYESGQGKVAKNPRCLREYVGTETDSVDDLGYLQQEGWSLYKVFSAAPGADENTVTVLTSDYYTRHK